jgi:hypothetical protein
MIDYFNNVIAPLNNGLADLLEQPYTGQQRIKWYTAVATNGELVTIEVWNGLGWQQFGLDADMTIEEVNDTLNDLQALKDDLYHEMEG